MEKDPTKFCSYEEFEAGVSTLKEFCALRAESVKAQLEGIIGSTSDTQDEGELIDAGDIKISDMGSMGAFENGRTEMPFGGTGEFKGSGESDKTGDDSEVSPPSEEAAGEAVPGKNMPGGRASGGAPPDFPEGEGGAMPGEVNMPDGGAIPGGSAIPSDSDMPGGRSQASQSSGGGGVSGAVILTVLSVSALAFGLCFAAFYRRRG